MMNRLSKRNNLYALGLSLALIATAGLAAGCTIQAAPTPAVGVAPVTGAADRSATAAGNAGELQKWDGLLVCDGTDDLVIENADIRVDGNGPTAVGSCDIFIKNSHIEAGGVALIAQGSGDIKVVDSVIVGNSGTALSVAGSGDIDLKNAQVTGNISVRGSGDVRAAGSAIRGKVQTAGTGEFHDEGGNEWQ